MPYKGAAPAFTDLMAKQVQLMFGISAPARTPAPIVDAQRWGELIGKTGIEAE